MFSIALLVASFWSTSNLNYVAVAVFGILLDLFLQIIKADIYIYIYMEFLGDMLGEKSQISHEYSSETNVI
jgi:hypothetical protein